MELAIDEVLKSGKIAEGTICYTGDITDPKRDKYSLSYYVNLAKELERRGVHMLCVKDMAGLLKPFAAQKLVKALKNEVGIPIHLHTHDTSGNQIAAYLLAAEDVYKRQALRQLAESEKLLLKDNEQKVREAIDKTMERLMEWQLIPRPQSDGREETETTNTEEIKEDKR